MRATALILVACLWGCGYQMVRPAADGGAGIGSIVDLSTHGDLGLRAREIILRRTAGLGADWTIHGTVRTADQTTGLAVGPTERMRRVGVVVELDLRGVDGVVRARSGPVRRTRPAPIGLDLVETHGTLRHITRHALDDAVNDALDRLLGAAGPGDRS